MAEVDYVENPDSFSLYKRDNGDNIGVFGDDHKVSYGGQQPDPRNADVSEVSRAKRVTEGTYVSDYIESLLKNNNDLHVYVEAPDEVVRAGPDGVNDGLLSTMSLAGIRGIGRRVHNIDNRNSDDVIPHDLYFKEGLTKKDLTLAETLVRRYVSDRAPEMINQFEQDIQKARGEWRGNDDDKRDALNILMRTVVDADMIRTIKQNPHGARDMLFYVGGGHKDAVERDFLDKPRVSGVEALYKRRATIDDPIPVTRFIGRRPPDRRVRR
jgi:hypothetical protein